MPRASGNPNQVQTIGTAVLCFRSVRFRSKIVIVFNLFNTFQSERTGIRNSDSWSFRVVWTCTWNSFYWDKNLSKFHSYQKMLLIYKTNLMSYSIFACYFFVFSAQNSNVNWKKIAERIIFCFAKMTFALPRSCQLNKSFYYNNKQHRVDFPRHKKKITRLNELAVAPSTQQQQQPLAFHKLARLYLRAKPSSFLSFPPSRLFVNSPLQLNLQAPGALLSAANGTVFHVSANSASKDRTFPLRSLISYGALFLVLLFLSMK